MEYQLKQQKALLGKIGKNYWDLGASVVAIGLSQTEYGRQLVQDPEGAACAFTVVSGVVADSFKHYRALRDGGSDIGVALLGAFGRSLPRSLRNFHGAAYLTGVLKDKDSFDAAHWFAAGCAVFYDYIRVPASRYTKRDSDDSLGENSSLDEQLD